MNTGKPIGLVVDAGSGLGFGHAVRCLRLARAFAGEVAIYPISDDCRRFFETNGFKSEIRDLVSDEFPPVVITDLRESCDWTARIRNQGSVHISLHDLGLAQCQSDIAIDGSVTRLIPFAEDAYRALFLGPEYMITRTPVERAPIEDVVFVTLGGGASAEAGKQLEETLKLFGLRVITTSGLGSIARTSDSDIERAMSTCRFAISASGTALYDLLASGVPTIAVALDRLQLRTAEAFQGMGAAVSAGLIDRLSNGELKDRCDEVLKDNSLVSRMTSIGRSIVDGKGLARVVDIIRNPGRDTWTKHQTQTCTVC